MRDNALFKLIISTLNDGLTAIGINGVIVQQSYQPTQQGIPTGPTIFLYKIGPDIRIAQPERTAAQGTGHAVFTGSITQSVLTVSAISSGTILANQALAGAGISTNLIVLSQLSGTTGGAGTYQLNQSPAANISSEAMTSTGTWVYTESTQYSSTFQASALATQTASNTDSLTASDIANYAAGVLQSQAAIDSFEAMNVGVLRIEQARNPFFSDDRQRYEASPSFDFTLTHHQTIITSVPVVDSTEFAVDRV